MDSTYPIRFWPFLIIFVPSTLCTLFNLYHFLVDRVLRQALNNHVIMVVLFIGLFYNLTDIIWFIHYYRTGSPVVSTYTFCIIWAYVDDAGFVSILMLVAWASIERHILVFHSNLVATSTKRFLIHYLPLVFFTVYPFIYYVVIFFILPCDIPADYTQRRCYLDYCAYTTELMGQWDNIAHNIVPVFIIVTFSSALLGRLWYSKYRVRQRFQWRNYRKLSVQLLAVSAVYFLLYFPTVFLYALYTGGVYFNGMDDYFAVGYYLCYFMILLTPFVCTVSLPELRTKLQNVVRICCRQRGTIGPIILPMNRRASVPR